MGLPEKPVPNAYHNFVTASTILQLWDKQYNKKMKTSMRVKLQNPNVLCL